MLAPRWHGFFGYDKEKFNVFLGSVGDWDIWARETIDQNEHRFAVIDVVAQSSKYISLDSPAYKRDAKRILGTDFNAVVALIKMFGHYDVDA